MKFHQTVLSDDTSERFDEDENSSKRARAKWLYQQNKLGLFIHWGLYSFLASTYQNQFYYGISEWIMHPQMANIPLQEYKAYAASFDPKRFNATFIVQLAKLSGMKYIIMTAKHHDGFAMYQTTVGKTGPSPVGQVVQRSISARDNKPPFRIILIKNAYLKFKNLQLCMGI
jgi:alpha-L-fucosidase